MPVFLRVSAPLDAIVASPLIGTPVATFPALPTNMLVAESVGESLPLNVFQSVELMAPVVVVLAVAILIAGVEVPVATEIGAVPVTLVTEPTAAAVQAHVVPFHFKISPSEHVAEPSAVPVPFAITSEFAVYDVSPVPPRETGRVPVVSFPVSRLGMSVAAKPLNAGAAGTPVDGPANTVLTA